jgi:hypothetical protein
VGEAWLGSEACATATPTKLEGLSSNPSNKTEEIVEGTHFKFKLTHPLYANKSMAAEKDKEKRDRAPPGGGPPLISPPPLAVCCVVLIYICLKNIYSPSY